MTENMTKKLARKCMAATTFCTPAVQHVSSGGVYGGREPGVTVEAVALATTPLCDPAAIEDGP